MKALGTVYASFILILVITAMLIASYQVINNGLNVSSRVMHNDMRKLKALSVAPVMDITYANNSLYLVIQVVEPIRIKYVFINYLNGTISFIPLDRYIVKQTYIRLPIKDYIHPFKVGVIIDPGIIIYYNPVKDPWLINNNIRPNTTYIDQRLINELQKTNSPSINRIAGFNSVFANNVLILNNVNSTVTETRLDLASSPLRIKLKITRLITPNFTITYPINVSHVLESNGIVKLATVSVEGYPISIYGIYTTFSSTYLFSVVGILINSSVSTNIVFNGTIRVEQSMSPTPVFIGGYFVKINNQYLNTPLALAPIANTTIKLRGEQFIKQVGLNKITYLSINGSTAGTISSDGMIVLGYGRYVKNIGNAPARINITVDLNITSIELINWSIRPISIGVDSQYITIRRWRIGISTLNSDNYAKALYSLFKLTGYDLEEPTLIINYGEKTIHRIITGSTSPIYVKTNYMISIKPSIPRWLLEWRSILNMHVQIIGYTFQYESFKILGKTNISSSAQYINLFPDVIIIKQYPSHEQFIILIPHHYSQFHINSGYTWQTLAAIVYTNTTIRINNPFSKSIVLSIIPVQLKSGEEPLTMYYEPEILGKTSKYNLVLGPGVNDATIELPPGYYIVVPLSSGNTIIYMEPIIVKVI